MNLTIERYGCFLWPVNQIPGKLFAIRRDKEIEPALFQSLLLTPNDGFYQALSAAVLELLGQGNKLLFETRLQL
jgi:hypothetical protein